MGVSYAGIDLFIDDKLGKAQEFLNKLLPLDDGRMVVDWDAPTKGSNFAGTTAACYTGQPLLGLNYSKPQRPKVSVWYQPTGASRWSFGFFFCDYARVKAIQGQLSSSGTGATLLLTADSGGVKHSRGFKAFMLPPHPISTNAFVDTALWLVPLVDERYFWQFITPFILSPNDSPPVGGILDDTAKTERAWQDFFNAAAMTSSNDTVSSVYLRPNYFALASVGSYTNAAVVLDIMLHSVFQRIVPNYPAAGLSTIYGGGDWKAIGFGNSAGIRAGNLQYLYDIAPLQVGTLGSDYPGLLSLAPSTVTVYFRPWANGIVLPDWYQNRYSKTISAASQGITSSTGSYGKSFLSTALADFTTGAGTPDNQAALDALATQIASDFYASVGWVQDSVVVGISQWQESGFDDYIEFDVGWLNPATGERQSRTRIHSVPYNFTCETLCHYDSTTWEYGDRVIGTLDGDLAAGGTQTITLTNSDGPLPSGTNHLTVTSIGSISGTSGSVVTALRERDVWGVISAVGGSGGNASVFLASPAAVQVAGTSGTFNKAGGGTVTATVLEGVCIPANSYLILTDGTTYWASNPDMKIPCQVTAVTTKGASCTATLYGGTQGSETSLTTTVTAWVRTGIVVTSKTYELGYLANGWEILNPDNTFHAQFSAITVGAGSHTAKIYTGTIGGESDSGVTVGVYQKKGVLFTSTTYLIGIVENGYEVLNPTLTGKGQTNAAHAKGANGTINIFTGSGDGSSAGASLTAWNAFAALATTKNVQWAWNDDSAEFRLVAGEC